MQENIFDREELLIGKDDLSSLTKTKIAVFGIGGVGSFVAEALARAGVGNIDLFDGDVVAKSNINRQLIALHSTIGKPKVNVMSDRITDINPNCVVKANFTFVDRNNLSTVIFSEYDYVIDAIDTVMSKLLIIESCNNLGIPIISCMGTGNKLHGEMFQITDISKTSMCPLAKVMRKELKSRKIYNLKVLYSTEQPVKNNPPGSISFVPPVAGMLIAGEVIRDILR